MGTLSLDKFPEIEYEFERVPVPEFGQGEDGTDYEVNVRGLSVAEWDWMVGQIFDVLSIDGTRELRQRTDYNEIVIAAALGSYDDDGRLVFGSNRADAVARLKALPREYRPALARIHSAVLRLSGIKRNLAASIEDTKKKSKTGRDDASSSSSPES